MATQDVAESATDTTTGDGELIDQAPDGAITVIGSINNLKKYDPIEQGLTKLEEKHKGGPPSDLSIKANYEACRLALAELRKVRTGAEKLRKELKADALAYGRKVDSTAKAIIDRVAVIEEPFATAKTNHDNAVEIAKREAALSEERRVDGISTRIATISALVTAHISSSSAVIEALFPELNNDLVTCDEWAQEFAEKARGALADTIRKLEELHEMKVQQETAAAQQAQANKEAAERTEAERIQREQEAEKERVRLAAERKKLDDERDAFEAEKKRLADEQAEKDRIAAEKAEQQALEQRLADEQAENSRVEASYRDTQNRISAEQAEKVNAAQQSSGSPATGTDVFQRKTNTPTAAGYSQEYKEAGNAILTHISNKKTAKEIAKAVLDAIIRGDIPHLTFTGENA